MSSDIAEVAEIMRRVRRWPATNRIALAKRILDSLDRPEVETSVLVPSADRPLRGASAEAAYGMLRTEASAPRDEECRWIVEEERWRK